jgi:hypothetical protein
VAGENGKVWLIKPEGLYDTFETEDVDISEYFDDDGEEECLGTYNGGRFRRV